MPKQKDLTGKRFGKLTAIEQLKDLPGKPWRCKCDCGGEKITFAAKLNSGNVQSCGCRKSDVKIKDITGQKFGRLTALRRTGKKRNNSQVWECICECGNTCEVPSGYLCSGKTRSCGCMAREVRSIAMHKALAIRKDHYIDGTDVYQLGQSPKKNNTSGTVGVVWDVSTQTWKAKIEFQKKRYYLGSSKSKEEAIALRKEAEKRIHGEFLKWYEKEVASKKGAKNKKKTAE